MATSESGAKARELLLERAVDYLTEHGVGAISLRELARALGTSHRMILYHFGSKEGLFVEVVRATERRSQAVLADLFREGDGSLEDVAADFWQRLSAPELAPVERLFFEVYGQALQGRAYALPLLDGVVDSWTEPARMVLEREGLSERDARADARLGLAVVRGLLLDLLATGDHTGVQDAFDRYLAHSRSGRSAGEIPRSAAPQDGSGAGR